MPIPFVRAFAAAFVLVFLMTSGVLAQIDAPSLAPQGALSIDIPSPLETDPRRSQTLSPVSPGSLTKTVLSLSALFFEKRQPDFAGR